MTLFDPGPPVVAEHDENLSATQRLTLRRKAMLDAGIHPTSRRPLLVFAEGTGPFTCGGCAHHLVKRRGNTYHKCAKAHGGLTGGPASDVRVSWPACDLYQPDDATGAA